MTEIDLIPASWRRRQWQRDWLIASAGTYAGALVVAVAVSVTFLWMEGRLAERVALLQEQKAVSTREQERVQTLTLERQELQRQLGLLNDLRRGAAAEQIFETIDTALVSGDVWFTEWSFNREGVVVDPQQTAETTGYMIVIPRTGNASAETRVIETHMKVRGQAVDYAALSGFVRRLLLQDAISDVKVVQTSVRRYTFGDVVNFDLAVVVGPDREAGNAIFGGT